MNRYNITQTAIFVPLAGHTQVVSERLAEVECDELIMEANHYHYFFYEIIGLNGQIDEQKLRWLLEDLSNDPPDRLLKEAVDEEEAYDLSMFSEAVIVYAYDITKKIN